MKNLERIGPTLLIFFSIGISVIFAYTATQRTLSGLESMIWQIFVLTAGLAGSFMFGRQSAEARRHGKSSSRMLDLRSGDLSSFI